MINVVFIAPHGTGKGTQCAYLEKEYELNHLSTGDLVRNAIKKQDALAKELEITINSGKLVSDEIVLGMIKDYLKKLDNQNGVIYDGYPRNIKQAQALDNLLKELNQKLDLVFYLEIPKEEAFKRTLGRLTCPNCQSSYNKFYEKLKPKKDNICDNCGAVLTARSDDNEETFNKLFDVFLNDTLPILDYYQEKNILRKIDATQDKDAIYEEVRKEIEALND